jgi:hypothetical protein
MLGLPLFLIFIHLGSDQGSALARLYLENPVYFWALKDIFEGLAECFKQ